MHGSSGNLQELEIKPLQVTYEKVGACVKVLTRRGIRPDARDYECKKQEGNDKNRCVEMCVEGFTLLSSPVLQSSDDALINTTLLQ